MPVSKDEVRTLGASLFNAAVDAIGDRSMVDIEEINARIEEAVRREFEVIRRVHGEGTAIEVLVHLSLEGILCGINDRLADVRRMAG